MKNILLFLQVLLFLSLKGQYLIPFSTDTIKVQNNFVVDDIMSIHNSLGDVFVLDFDDKLYLSKKKTGYEFELINYFEYSLPYSLSKYSSDVVFYGGKDDEYEIKVYDSNIKEVIKSKKIEKKHSITPAHTYQNENSVFIIHYYFNESRPKQVYDLIRLYKYSKKKNKIINKIYIDVGPESVLAPLGYQMVGHINGKTYVATPLSGLVKVMDENLKIIEEFQVDSTIAELNQPFIDYFLSDEKVKGFYRKPRNLILSFKQEFENELKVLSRILPLPNNKIFLQYTDPNDIKNYDLFVYDINKNKKQPLYVNQNYQRYFYYDLTLNSNGNIQALSIESNDYGETYFLLTTFSIVEDGSLIDIKDLSGCIPEIDLLDFKNFLLLDLPRYCSGCFSQQLKSKTVYLAHEKHVIDEHINRSYLEQTFRASLKTNGKIIYLNKYDYKCLMDFMRTNQIYYLRPQ